MQIIPHVEQESSSGSENKENLSELGRQTSLDSSVNKYSNESTTIQNPKGQSGKFTRCCVINTRGFRPAILETRTVFKISNELPIQHKKYIPEEVPCIQLVLMASFVHEQVKRIMKKVVGRSSKIWHYIKSSKCMFENRQSATMSN